MRNTENLPLPGGDYRLSNSQLSQGSISTYVDRADAYSRARPTYPKGIIDLVRPLLGGRSAPRIVDVGAGTGLLTQLFLENEYHVIAVEPNDEMRAIAEKRLSKFHSFTSVNGTAEATTLPNNFADLIVIGQALHWFDLESAKKEFWRILRGPKVALVIYNHRKLDCDAFHQELEADLLVSCENYRKTKHFESHFKRLLGRFFGRNSIGEARNDNFQHLGETELVERFSSTSFAPLVGASDFLRFEAGLRNLHRRYAVNGQVVLKYDTGIYWGFVAECESMS